MPGRPAHVLSTLLAFSLAALAGKAEERTAPFQSTALPTRAETRGSTLFTTLSAEEIGLEFTNSYEDPRMWTDRYEEFAFGSIGTGVAIGDFDNDGRPDVYLVGRVSRSRLFRNLGGWRFEDVTDRAGLNDDPATWKVGAASADIDNDGDLDLYVCRSNAPNLLYLNQGDGTFRENAKAAGVDVVDASVMGHFADYDRDGWLDLYVQTNLLDLQRAPHGQRDYLFRNRGDGTFEPVTDKARIFGHTQGHGAMWWDADDDGWPDLHVGNDFVTPDQLYHNRRDGTFANVIDLVAPYFAYFAMGSDVGDVNNDGRLDLMVADMLPTSREQYVSGLLNMQAKMARPLPPNAAAQYMRNMLYLNTGTGRFQEAANLAGLTATDWSWSVRFEDLDEDGRVDLHVTNGMFRDFLDADLLARVNQVDPPARKRIVRAAPELREKNLAYRNKGDLQFENVSAAWGLDHFGISFGAAFGDLDGDGDLDLVFSNYNAAPTVCRNDSSNAHRVLFELRGTQSNRGAVGAQVKIETSRGVQVRQLTASRGYLSTSEPLLHFGLGDAAKIDRVSIRWPSGREQIIEHLEADRRYIISEPAADAPVAPARPKPQFSDISAQANLSLSWTEAPVDEFAAQPLLPARQQSVGPSLAIGDLDGDDLDDVILGGGAGQPLRLLLQIGPKHLPGGNPLLTSNAAAADAGILIFEANGDGTPDLFIAKGGASHPAGASEYQPRLLLGRGSAFFSASEPDALPNLPFSAASVAAADYDRDGRLDLFVSGRVVPGDYGAAPQSALLHNEGGRFSDVTARASGLAHAGHVQAALWSDVDGDGWLDLLVASHWGTIRCWRNQEGNGWTDVSEQLGFSEAGSGWWNSIAAADFNGDGVLDYAVGNYGLNTRYRATPSQPAVLVSGVFDATSRKHLIEGETIDGRLLPIRARDTVLAAMPSLRSRVPTYRAYARASVEELLGEKPLASAERFEVTELRSGVFLSSVRSQERTFRFQPLPRPAQLAPIFGLAAGDFDGDGRADLYAVQNTHASHPEIGRFAGGISQFMRGDGDGDFECVDAQESGLLVTGEARALAIKDFDLNGWPDFVVSRQHATTLAFLNRESPGRHSFAVRLVGSSGNPSAIGARVTVRHASGEKQTAEVHAGSGYLSQSSTRLFFGFPENDPPLEMIVNWPNGATSVHPHVRGAALQRLSQPR